MTDKTLVDLLEALDIKKIRYQCLNDSLDGNQSVSKGGGVRLTFLSDVDMLNVIDGSLTGLVVWVDRDDLVAARHSTNLPPAKALKIIATMLDGQEWDVSMLDSIAEILRTAGHEIRDVGEIEEA